MEIMDADFARSDATAVHTLHSSDTSTSTIPPNWAGPAILTNLKETPMPDPIRRHRTPSDPETLALGAIMRALAPLEAAAKRRVLKYVADKFTEMPGAGAE